MQKIMDQYAGGISTDYQYNEARLELADEKIKFLEKSIDNLAAQDADDLLRIYDKRETYGVQKCYSTFEGKKRNTLAQLCGEHGLSG